MTAANDGRARRQLEQTRLYFEKHYPDRSSLFASLFRRGESERAALLAAWLKEVAAGDVLDVGCGDGALLDSILPPQTRHVVLEDIVAKSAAAAAVRLGGRAVTVEASTADVNETPSDRRFDVVLAVGVLDYNPCWEQILPRLARRTRGTLILDFPRGDRIRPLLRRAWLRWHGVDCRFATERDVHALIGPLCPRYEVRALSYNWCARLFVGSS